jgi:hypothetical protein
VLRVFRHLDLLVLVLALPLFAAAGFPLLGWAVGAGAWLAQRGVQVLLERRALATSDPRTFVGLTAGGMILRGWLVAGAIFGAGLVDEDAGLGAAVLFLAIFTVYFSMGMAMRPFDEAERKRAAAERSEGEPA